MNAGRVARCATIALVGAVSVLASVAAPLSSGAATEPSTDAAGSSGAAAAVGDGFSVIEEPDGASTDGPSSTAGARMAVADVEAVVLADLDVSAIRTRRPGSSLVSSFDPSANRWRVRVREPGSTLDLASIDVDDTSGEIVAREVLPIGDYPSRLTSRGAIDIAVADPEARKAAEEFGGVDALRARTRLDGPYWEVDLVQPGRDGPHSSGDTVVRVDIFDTTGEVTAVWTGIQIAWKMSRGKPEAFGGSLNDRGTWLPLLALFALVAIDWRRVRSVFTLDVLAILSFAVSLEAFQRAEIWWSVPLAMPPLLWLFGRMVWVYAHGLPERGAPAEPTTRLGRLASRRVPTWMLLVLVVALLGVRAGIAIDGGNVIDVGYAGVAGARLELDGGAPWGNMPEDNDRGDTYGPANYLAYVPATAAFDDEDGDVFGVGLLAARITSIAADALCVLLLAWIGWRWISPRGGALVALGWVACPWTTWALASGVNDSLVAVPLLAAFAFLPRATIRGALVGLAAMIKFAPLVALAPLLHAGRRGRGWQALRASIGAGVVVALGLAWVTWRLPEGVLDDLRYFKERTLDFQTERASPFSVWGLYDLSGSQKVVQGVVVLGLLVACIRPRRREAWQVAAGIAAVLIATQLVVTHWFYLYIPWFVGFTLLVLVAAREGVGAHRPIPTREHDADMLVR